MSDKIIQAADVRALCGNISDMTLWRWLNDKALKFPSPIYIGRRRYWREADVLTWLDGLSQKAETQPHDDQDMPEGASDGRAA